ncbi:MAG: hypothetical protein HY763_12960, partial [Planctomycetes bacterium]|nr:hypothetical protein [Planctomycetota bacterium]
GGRQCADGSTTLFAALEDSGTRVLRNESVAVGPAGSLLNIVGVDDMAVPDPAAAGEPAAVADAADQAPVRPTVLRGSPALIRVDLPRPHQRTFLNEQKFEVIVYVDDRRIIEVEQGHVPFTYPWDISSLGAGRHVLTVNVSSFRNHVGTVSRLVQKEP